MNIRTFKATLPDLEKIEDTDWFFAQAKEYFPQFMKEGYFKAARQEEVMIVQRVKSSQGDFVGLIACTDIEDYLAGKIVRHELTLEEKERKMMALTKERQAMIKPTMLTPRCSPTLKYRKSPIYYLNMPKNIPLITKSISWANNIAFISLIK